MWCASVVSAVRGSSCASFATRWSFVEMVDEPGVSFIVPSTSSMLRHRLPSTGSLGSVPPLQRYYAVLRLPAAHPVSLRCLRSTVPKSAPVSLPQRAEPARQGLGLVTRCPSGFTSEASGPPRFLDVPVAHMLRSRTPVESQRPGLLGRSMQPSAVVTASASTSTNSRGSLTQPARSLCTLRSAGYPHTTQHSVPAGGQPLPGGIRDPPGRTEGFGAPWSAPSPISRLGLAQHNFRLYLFYFKLCRRVQVEPLSSDLLPGMYLPRLFVEAALADSTFSGPRGGRIISSENVARHLTNTLFADLVRDGWIGTRGTSSSQIRAFLTESLGDRRSLVLGRSRPRGVRVDPEATLDALGLSD